MEAPEWPHLCSFCDDHALWRLLHFVFVGLLYCLEILLCVRLRSVRVCDVSGRHHLEGKGDGQKQVNHFIENNLSVNVAVFDPIYFRHLFINMY